MNVILIKISVVVRFLQIQFRQRLLLQRRHFQFMDLPNALMCAAHITFKLTKYFVGETERE